ncbi:4Fe-4S binding protein [bacterium]|nr:4Fe-4S binding protein [bacterium]
MQFLYGSAGAHDVCPFALVQSPILAVRHSVPLNLFTTGLIIGAVFLLAGLILPRVFCGWICPIGFISRLLRFLGKKIGFNMRISVKLNDRYAWFAVIVLLYIVIMTAISGRLYCIGGCPFFWGFAAFVMPIGTLPLIMLTFFFTGSLMIERFFCRWFCPYGALLGLVGRFSFFAIKRRNKNCGACRICYDCPMGTLPKTELTVGGPMCISCLRCVDVCKDSCLYLGRRREK